MIATLRRIAPGRYAIDGAEMSTANAIAHLAAQDGGVALNRSTLPDSDPVVAAWARMRAQAQRAAERHRDAGYERNPRQPGVRDWRGATANGSE